MAWFRDHGRDLPWRRTTDPYAILVSEVMLQQTQAARVQPAYVAFLRRFPSVIALAAAAPGEVVAAWQGLGYNRRAVALHRAAKTIVERHGGRVPDDLTALRTLPGVGDYTARAVLAFAYGREVVAVDTNVARVLARVNGRSLRGRQLQATADAAVPRGHARQWNAALMDLGATTCTARVARCRACPLQTPCAWRGRGPDPAARDRPAAAPFAGSDRFHRGRLVDALRRGPLHHEELAVAAQLADTARARRLAAGLVADGLAAWDAGRLRLPQ